MIGEHRSSIEVPRAAIAALGRHLRGAVIDASHPAYETARRVWNGMIDRRPSVIVRPSGVADVLVAVRWAADLRIKMAVRGGGHSVAGLGTCDGGLLLDLSSMRGVRVDPLARTAYALPGSTWSEYDRETQAFGLASTGGLISHTGIAGLTLGGGIGWLSRAHGLACDNLRAVDLVTAAGLLLHASEEEHADLFWAMRGAGANFGVVTNLEYGLHPHGPVIAGAVFYPFAQARAALRSYREYVAGAPDELSTLVALLGAEHSAARESGGHEPMVGFVVAYTGALSGADRWLRPLRTLGTPTLDTIAEMPYVALQSMSDADAPFGLRNYWKADNLADLSEGTIDVLLDFAERIPSPMTAVNIYHLGGALARVPQEATAYPHRAAPYTLNILSRWRDPAEDEAQRAWTRDFWQALRPHALGGTYVNFLGDEGQERVRAAYGDRAYERLAALKRRHDPTNLFCYNQNIGM